MGGKVVIKLSKLLHFPLNSVSPALQAKKSGSLIYCKVRCYHSVRNSDLSYPQW